MDSASNRILWSSARRVVLGLGLAALVAQSGCAQWNPFRKDDRPVFGTEPATTTADRDGAGPAASGDLYADRMKSKARPAAPADPAQRPDTALAATTTPRAETAPERSPSAPVTEGAQVALQNPVALRPIPEAGQAAPGGLSIPGSSDPAQAQGPTLESLLAESRRRLDALTSYQVKMNRQEAVGGTLNAPEDVTLSVKRNPKAVRLEWPDGPHKGREVIYAADANDGKMHVKMGDSLLAAMPRVAMAPDSPLALRNSRHPITEAGFDTILQRMEDAVRNRAAGDGDRIEYAGLEQADGLDKAGHKVVRVTPSGETWVVYLDAETGLPALVQANARDGQLLERYVFRDPVFNPQELASADAFNPDARWGATNGLLSRFARSGSANSPPEATQTR
jgi:hypothetical protein